MVEGEDIQEDVKKTHVNEELVMVTVTLDYGRTVNYAMQQNDVPVIKELRIKNESPVPLCDALVQITAEPTFAKPWEGRVAVLNPGESFSFGIIDLPLSHDYLASLTERAAGSLNVQVLQAGRSLSQFTHRIDVLAYYEWNGLQSIPEILAAFVTPNHPGVESVLSDATGILGTWTGDTSISGYQSRNPQRVALTAGAIYTALQKRNIRYINPPASFEESGQKIRLPDRILESCLATCLDLTVFTASCLEQAGLNPLIVITAGHAFAGVWLQDETFADVATDDHLRLRKRVELGQITVFESTLLTSEQAVSFEQAVNTGGQHLDNASAFRSVIDIKRARKSRIRPLPLRVALASALPVFAEPAISEPAAPPELNISGATVHNVEVTDDLTETPATRLDRWKRKLLDLTLHNRLLNFRESKKNLPILCPDLGALEDALADGTSFQVFPRLGDLGENDPRSPEVHRRRTGQESLNEMLREAFHSRRLHADVSEAEVNRRLLEIYREAKLSIEENGANTLYLALGFLAWYETTSSPQRRLAPIILIPLEIDRRSVQEGFTIRQGDDEPMVNVTLLAHLSNDFELTINGLDPIPMDAKGIDVQLILRKFKEAIVDIDRWEVLEWACIGHFSFTKFLMWRDLEVRAEDLQRNNIVRHLIHTPSEVYPDDGAFPDPDRLDETHSPTETFCPLSADSSQLAAVHAAAAGKSFVLHGPPGTGKSQTIANIIAHALAIGKTVLFVSEKRAALEVVHRRLTESGLGPYCLELHSNKSHKKEVLNQLEHSFTSYESHSSEEWLCEAQHVAATRKELNSFVNALHAIRPSGESVFHGLSQLIGHRDVPLIKLGWSSAERIDRQQLASLRETVRRLRLAGAQIVHPISNPWTAAFCETWTPELRNNVERMLEELFKTSESLSATAGDISAIVGMNQSDWSRDNLNNLAEIANALINCSALPQALLTSGDWDGIKNEVLNFVAHGRQRDSQRQKLYSRYRESILSLDLDMLVKQWTEAEKSWFLAKWLGCRKVLKVLKSVALQDHLPKDAEIVPDLKLAQALRLEEQYLKDVAPKAGEILGSHWRSGEADWDLIEKCIEHAESLRKFASKVADVDIDQAICFRQSWAKLISDGREQLAADGPIGRRLQAYVEASENFKKAEQALTALLALDHSTAWLTSSQNGFLKRVQDRCELWSRNLNNLRAWCHWRTVRKEALSANLKPLVDAYEKDGLPTEMMEEVFTRAYYQSWCDAVIGNEPALCSFFSSDFEDKIQQFREVDDRYINLTRKEIQARVAARLPKGQADNPNSETGFLRRQFLRQRGLLHVRALIQKIPNLLPRLKPCLLMSPISVAQYLDPSHPPFDLVVFDEASQIPVWDAVGAIARGNEAIIVGDPKQLPPTNFFSRVDSGDSTDVDDSLVEDLESILDDCIAAQLPERHLNWHYRSRHESLIAFSNYHYYGNRLLTFPSPHQELGVSFRPVAGEYDKGKTRTNRAEAEAVVNEILRRMRDPKLSRFSIGVVTFSLAQQLLVDDLLEEARRQDPQIEPYFSDSSIEPVFVKNLENVQGDERDVILFSICYGPDASGRVSMNFGPINRDGGERRLNVAITRARQEVIVFSTLRAENIDLSRTRAQGVADLKCFLDYAERGPAAIAERRATDPAGECESPFEVQVFNALKEKGYIIHSQVGCSGYRIDLAVVDPERPGRYILGIECDGANYHRSKTARDRDKLRESVLRGLSWNLHRVWSTDWWEKPEEELARIESAIKSSCSSPDEPETKVEAPDQKIAAAPIFPAPVVDTKPSGVSEAPSYRPHQPTWPIYEPFVFAGVKGAPEDFHKPSADGIISLLVEGVVNKEGPISLGLAARRVSEHWGISRVTSRVLKRFEQISRKAYIRYVCEKDGVILWPRNQNPEDFSIFRIPGTDEASKRDAADIPPQEVANAALHILEQHISLPLEDLVRETARIFGFQRIGPNVDKAMRSGISLLLKKGDSKEEKGIIIHNG
jgi:very-short-patch-repair endonuclease